MVVMVMVVVVGRRVITVWWVLSQCDEMKKYMIERDKKISLK
jgi:hypothetical protein